MYSTVAQRKLSRHATSILIGGLFLFISILLYLSLCAMPCEYAHLDVDDYEGVKRYPRQLNLNERKPHQTFLLVLILTGPKYFNRRDTIRQTWLSSRDGAEVKPYFTIGTANLSEEELGTLQYENSLHKDLLLLPSLTDSYYNLTTKVLESFRWIDHNVNFKYLLKVDDDTFVQLDKIVTEMKSLKEESRLYWGFFDGRATVKKSGKWAEPNWILCDTYTPYARGGGYVLTADLVHYIAKNSNFLQKFKSEDVSVGTWLGPVEIKRRHDVRFDTEARSRGCNNNYIVTHKQNVEAIKEKWHQLKATGHICEKEFQNIISFEYNWNVPPSLCCIRNNSNLP